MRTLLSPSATRRRLELLQRLRPSHHHVLLTVLLVMDISGSKATCHLRFPLAHNTDSTDTGITDHHLTIRIMRLRFSNHHPIWLKSRLFSLNVDFRWGQLKHLSKEVNLRARRLFPPLAAEILDLFLDKNLLSTIKMFRLLWVMHRLAGIPSTLVTILITSRAAREPAQTKAHAKWITYSQSDLLLDHACIRTTLSRIGSLSLIT